MMYTTKARRVFKMLRCDSLNVRPLGGQFVFLNKHKMLNNSTFLRITNNRMRKAAIVKDKINIVVLSPAHIQTKLWIMNRRVNKLQISNNYVFKL
jgi:hypothetical protein